MSFSVNTSQKEVVVIKIGGSTLDQEHNFIGELRSICTECRVVLVHGGGKMVSRWLGKLDIMPKFVDGLRQTDLPTLEVVTAILGGVVNASLVTELKEANINSVGISGVSFMHGDIYDEELGYVAEDAEPIYDTKRFFNNLGDVLPVIAPLVANRRRGNGEPAILNMNADTFVGCLAKFIDASKVIFVTDTEGVLDSNRRLIPHVTTDQARELVEIGVASAGMVPKIKACLSVLEVKPNMEAYIVSSAESDTLVRAVQGEKVGTTIYRPKV